MGKSLGRLDAVRHVETSIQAQTSTVTFKRGKPVDFKAIAAAIDKAGFKAGEMTIWARGTLAGTPDGRLTFTPSGTSQTLPLAETPQLAALKGKIGQEVSLVAKVEFEKTPPQLIVEGEGASDGKEAGAKDRRPGMEA